MGAGRIAQGYDEPGSERVLTLAHAIEKLPQLKLCGFYDLEPARAEAAEHKWGCPTSSRDREAWLDTGWDIILIATPDNSHVVDLEAVLQRKPKAVMVEKPLAPMAADAERLLKAASDQSTAILVDFPRRWHSGLQHVGRSLAANQFGRIGRIQGACSGGLRHNGVHLLDLIFDWCPGAGELQLLAKHGDAAWFTFETANGPVEFILSGATQESCYVWELRVDTDGARIELCDSPEILRLSRPAPHPNYPSHHALIVERTWSMEDEPLLVKMLACLTAMIGDTEAIRATVAFEIERERFFDAVLRHFEN
jgi:predicted dehydrogenase